MSKFVYFADSPVVFGSAKCIYLYVHSCISKSFIYRFPRIAFNFCVAVVAVVLIVPVALLAELVIERNGAECEAGSGIWIVSCLLTGRGRSPC
jgi:hypothetical protein